MSEESRKMEGSEASELKGEVEKELKQASELNGEAEKETKQTETETKEELSSGDGVAEKKDNQDGSEQKTTEEGTKTGESQEEEFMDILGNGTLLKKVFEPGTGKNPQMGEKVTIRMNKTIPEIGKEFPDQEVTFILGDCDVEQALDLCVSLMKLGEKAILISGYKYMYGELGLEPDIPPRSNFKLDIYLTTNHGFPDLNKMDLEERFTIAKEKKERGNFYFRRKEYSQAVYVYTKANKIVDPEEGCVYPDASPKLLQELLEFRGIILANTSVAQLKVGAADAAIKSAIEATKLCPSYSKAYFRLGQAYEGKGQIDEAIKAHKLALKNDPDNSKETELHQVIHNELSRLTKLNKEAKKSEQQMYSKMFWGSNPPNVANSEKSKTKDASMEGPTPSPHQSTADAACHATLGKTTQVNKGASSQNVKPLDEITKVIKAEASQIESLASLAEAARAANHAAVDEAVKIKRDESYKNVSLAALYEGAQAHKDDPSASSDSRYKFPTAERYAAAPEDPSSERGIYVEINQMYARMHHVTWSTDVDTGNTYREELINVDDVPPQDILEQKDGKKQSSWFKNPLLLGTIGAGLAGAVSLGVYRYLNTH